MKRRFSTRFELSARTTTIISVILGCTLYGIGIYVTRGAYKPGHTVLGIQIQVLSPYLSLTLLAMGLILPWLLKLAAFLDIRLWPRPGAYALPGNQLSALEKAFSLERDKIEEATVPSHLPTAKTATSSLAVHLGDASLVLPPSDQRIIQGFIARPRNPRLGPAASRQECEQEVLMITGEPGGGKSVILQELHASLSFGVEKGFHSFIPIIVFARDLTLSALAAADEDSETPVKTFLTAHYAARCAHLNAAELRPLQNLISHDWDRLDFFVLFDGLDEIAQRSVYERIQQTLARFILKDLHSGRLAVHRFVLSCRTDEDLELFRDAHKVSLRGLRTEQDRERFCQAVITQASASPLSRRSLERTLNSRRLVPDHVFKRNPYFLALLVGHLRDEQDRVQEEALDFDFLMRKYLEREAYRPYTSLQGPSSEHPELRRGLFNELETVARLCLQFLAFRCASSIGLAGLYDEITVDGVLLQAFFAEVDRPQAGPGQKTWGAISELLEELSESPAEVSHEVLENIVLAGHLHENDVRVLRELAVRTRGKLPSEEAIFASFGSVPFRRLLEEESWYRSMARQIYTAAAGLTLSPRHLIALFLFSRSLAAAHVLRILWINSGKKVTLRFRHRRLAEYYAACFLKNRWRDLEQIAFTPWLAPIMNLTCAIEGGRCWALRWLVERVPHTPTEPRYEWRHGIEAAVEAAFFAQPGAEYSICVRDLLSLVLATLQNYGLHSIMNGEGVRVDIVTEMTLVRAIDNLSRLRTWSGRVSIEQQEIVGFQKYEAVQPPEWIAEFAVASRGLTVLTGKHPPAGTRIRTLWKLIQQPSALLSSPRWRQPGLSSSLITVWASIILGEGILFAAFAGLIVAGLRTLAGSSVSDAEFAAVRSSLVMSAAVPWSVMRCQAWVRSRSRAAFWSSAAWRLVPTVVRAMKAAAQPGVFVLRCMRGFFEFVWRESLAVGLGLLILAGVGFVVLRRTDIKWFKASIPPGQATTAENPAEKAKPEPTKPKPCPDIDSSMQHILASFDALPKDAKIDTVVQLRQNLTTELAKLRKANQSERCGFDTAEGWVLAEERVADLLFERDPRLVPLPEPNGSNSISEADTRRLVQLLKEAPPAEPQPGVIGSILLFQRRQELAGKLKDLKELRRRALQSRRDGAVDRLDEAAKEADRELLAATLIESADRQLKQFTDVQTKLERRGTSSILWLVVGAVPTLLLTSVGIRQARKVWNHRKLKKVLRTATIPGLCAHLEKQTYTEWIRREIIRSIANRDNISSEDLNAVEQTGERIYSRHSFAEKQIAVQTADLATAIAKRLRHRMVDSPSKSVAGRQGE